MRSSISWLRAFRWTHLAVAGVALLLVAGAAPIGSSATLFADWQPFSILSNPHLSSLDQLGLIGSMLVALLGLGYAGWLVKQIYALPIGTPGMQRVAQAVREGANAYLRRQFIAVGILIVLISAALIAAKWPWSNPDDEHARLIAIGRGGAFLMGSLFSAFVGFAGMRLATAGNLRVAQAARTNFGEAFRTAYRTGTVTGMLTVGLGLFGGSLIVLLFGTNAFEILVGFGFGGSLLALFMRVGGGIYTKAADVGADLVGKVEAGMAEDDPRNAATIADNVGDNVGDCAGMAADVFESYAVTLVAALMLGFAALGPKGLIFPLVVLAVGVVCSMISTSLVGKGLVEGKSTDAMRRINWGFRRSAVLSVIGFFGMGALFLNFDKAYVIEQAIDRGLYDVPQFHKVIDFPTPGNGGPKPEAAVLIKGVRAKWDPIPFEKRQEIANLQLVPGTTVYDVAYKFLPLTDGLYLHIVYASLIGILLAIALNFCTEYWTSTDYSPVRNLTKSCRTGHATNIISGLSLGYESAVWAVLIVAAAILGSVMLFIDTGSPIFIAFGVAMCGIGMLTLTGDTISMDVFGPIADNASGIGEMGYNKDANGHSLKPGDEGYMTSAEEEVARRRLTDLDAVGNTTKAITKGIAIGSAVIAAVSLFASFVAVMITGSEEKVATLTAPEFIRGEAMLTVAEPFVFIGMLLGAAVPFLFSAMTIRAVGRAAYLIVNECRRQFRIPGIMEGTVKPDYGNVVAICTATAQRELIGPGILAIFTPLAVGFILGPEALGGFLAGTIVSGQLLAVFMSNAGGGWDNAKKMVEDEPRSTKTGKNSEKHRASVTGDTVGDPLKDTAGPAINPLIKVMNLVSLLALPFIIMYNLPHGTYRDGLEVGGTVAFVSVLLVFWAWRQSKKPSKEEIEIDRQFEEEEAAAIAAAQHTPQG